MTWFDQLVLLGTGLVAIYLIIRFIQDYLRKGKPFYDIYYIIAFSVLLVAGLLLIFLGYGILPAPSVVVVTTLIPLAIATGLVNQYYEKNGKAFLLFAIVGFILIALTRFLNVGGALATIVLIIVHSIAGLEIFFIPILLVREKKVPGGFIMVSVGGFLIGLGGIALAFLKSGSQLLFFSQEFVMTILAPLLFLMTLAYTWGFVKKIVTDKKS